MSNTISDELRFQKRIERTLELAKQLLIHKGLTPSEALSYAETFLKTTREYAIDKRCEFNGVLRDTEDDAS